MRKGQVEWKISAGVGRWWHVKMMCWHRSRVGEGSTRDGWRIAAVQCRDLRVAQLGHVAKAEIGSLGEIVFSY